MCVNKCESGLLHKVHKTTKNRYVFRCDCAYGQRLKYPEWKGVNAVDFESPVLELPKQEVSIEEEW